MSPRYRQEVKRLVSEGYGPAAVANVPLSNVAGLPFGLDRNAKYRALQWLEDAGLICVERKLGWSPVEKNGRRPELVVLRGKVGTRSRKSPAHPTGRSSSQAISR